MDVLKNKVMINIVLLQQKQLVLHGKPDMKTLESEKLGFNLLETRASLYLLTGPGIIS